VRCLRNVSEMPSLHAYPYTPKRAFRLLRSRVSYTPPLDLTTSRLRVPLSNATSVLSVEGVPEYCPARPFVPEDWRFGSVFVSVTIRLR